MASNTPSTSTTSTPRRTYRLAETPWAVFAGVAVGISVLLHVTGVLAAADRPLIVFNAPSTTANDPAAIRVVTADNPYDFSTSPGASLSDADSEPAAPTPEDLAAQALETPADPEPPSDALDLTPRAFDEPDPAVLCPNLTSPRR